MCIVPVVCIMHRDIRGYLEDANLERRDRQNIVIDGASESMMIRVGAYWVIAHWHVLIASVLRRNMAL